MSSLKGETEKAFLESEKCALKCQMLIDLYSFQMFVFSVYNRFIFFA